MPNRLSSFTCFQRNPRVTEKTAARAVEEDAENMTSNKQGGVQTKCSWQNVCVHYSLWLALQNRTVTFKSSCSTEVLGIVCSFSLTMLEVSSVRVVRSYQWKRSAEARLACSAGGWRTASGSPAALLSLRDKTLLARLWKQTRLPGPEASQPACLPACLSDHPFASIRPESYSLSSPSPPFLVFMQTWHQPPPSF